MTVYAENTAVPVERSRAEIERILERYGADSFLYGWDRAKAVVRFRANERQIAFVLELPDRNDKKFTHFKRGRVYPSYEPRSPDAAQKAWEQGCRQAWRALTLVIKAKLEAVSAGITDFESEFLAHIVLPDGSTVGDFIKPQIAQSYASGKMPSLLPALGPGASNDLEGEVVE